MYSTAVSKSAVADGRRRSPMQGMRQRLYGRTALPLLSEELFSPRSFSLSRRSAVNWIVRERRRTEYHRKKIAAERVPPGVPGQFAKMAQPAIRITGSSTARNTPMRLTEIAKSRSSVIGNGTCAILQTTPQLWT